MLQLFILNQDPGCYNLTKTTLIVTEDRESSVKSTTVIYQAGDMSTKRNV